MQDFPEFMKNPKNRRNQSDQHTPSIEGYYYEGADGSQMAFWTCHADRVSASHFHEFDEYVVCIQGEFTAIIEGKQVTLMRATNFSSQKAHRMEANVSRAQEPSMLLAVKESNEGFRSHCGSS
jgi:hypothetical protein